MRVTDIRLPPVELESNLYPMLSPTNDSPIVSAQDVGEDVTLSDTDDDSPLSSEDTTHFPSRISQDFASEDVDVQHILRSTNSSLLSAHHAAYERIQNLWTSIPPKNFGEVKPGVYRSSFPKTENLSFLAEKRIKTILTFVPEQYTTEQKNFIRELGINHIRIPIEANKDPFRPHTHTPVVEALGHILDQNNYPILIHCNKGKHRTGCVVACYRKFLGWDKASILQEYRRYAGLKARVLDELFIDRFDERGMQIIALQSHLINPHDEPMTDSPITSLIPNSRLRG